MNTRRRVAIGSILIVTGACLLAVVVSMVVYGQVEAWVQAQPRVLVSTQIAWPRVPPMTALPSPTPVPSPTCTSTPTPTPTPGLPVLLEIPSLGIERAIVPVGTVAGQQGPEWDADKLFATSSRRDLVGHLEGSARPGQAGNVVLIGHNYNRGLYNWLGVFYALQTIEQDAVVRIVNENDEVLTYQVDSVDKVPWRSASPDALPHIIYLSPTQDETLTMVTCGGANFAPFPSRIYVIAKRKLADE
jgi:LPXTG-site transpeptidase (sortase) family protein